MVSDSLGDDEALFGHFEALAAASPHLSSGAMSPSSISSSGLAWLLESTSERRGERLRYRLGVLMTSSTYADVVASWRFGILTTNFPLTPVYDTLATQAIKGLH